MSKKKPRTKRQTQDEKDNLCGQVGFVLNEYINSERAMDLASRCPVDA